MILCNHDPEVHAQDYLSVFPKLVVALVAFFALSLPAPASPPRLLALTGPVEAVDLMPSFEYIIDPDWQRSVSELAAPTSEGWQPVTGASANFGYTSARIWLRVAVVNRTAEISDWRVFVQANFWPTLQIWSIGADGRTATLMDLCPDSPFDARPIAHP